jgi:signal transduction histidine kinase
MAPTILSFVDRRIGATMGSPREPLGVVPDSPNGGVGHDDAMSPALRRAVLVLVVVAQTVFVAVGLRQWILDSRADTYQETLWDWLLAYSFFAGAVLAVVAGALLSDRQRGNRCGAALLLLGVAMAMFWSCRSTSWQETTVGFVVGLAGLALLRPLLVWVLLAWPTGRLGRWEASAVIGFGVSHVALVFATQMMFEETPISVTSLTWLGNALLAFQFVVVTVAVDAVVLLVVVRRFRALARPARSLAWPVVVAAALLLAGDLAVQPQTFLTAWTHGNGHRLTTVGYLSTGIDLLRFIAIPLVLLVAAARRRGVRGERLVVELGALTQPASMATIIAETLGDDRARVLYPAGAGWVDGDGLAVEPCEDRQLTRIERGDQVVVAVEHGVVGRPAALEAAASTLGLLAEHRALEASTQAQLRELRRLRTSMLEAEDATRQRLERDLHDGAQQQILALALQARLPGAMDDRQLATEIRRVARDLRETAEGATERVIAERGLQSFLEALTAMSPVAVVLSGCAPDTLEPPVAATAWFVASEGVGNAAKHASAVHVSVDVRPVGSVLRVAVDDDGCGGADPAGGGLAGLARRVRGLGGELVVHSPRGAGTSLVASLPLGAGP